MADKKEKTQFTWRSFIKWVNIISALALIGLGILKFISILGDFGFNTIVIPVYLVLFGIMGLAGDLNLKWITDYCAFLGNFFGRGLFNIYIGSTIMMSYWEANILSWICFIAGGVIAAFGLTLIILGFCARSGKGGSDIQAVKGYVEKNYKVGQNMP